jgi:phospholipase/carboxylesterase
MLLSRAGSALESGWNMNRLATQPITFNPPQPSSSKTPILLPLDELSGAGRPAETRKGPPARPAIFCPLHYEPGYAYPLIVWLHDAGENEQVLRRVVPRISLRNYIAVAPRDASADAHSDQSEAAVWSQSADGVERAGERVFDAIQFVRGNLNISLRRIFVAGQGAGGTMALRLAFEHPQRFAGAISLDGLLPREGLPMRRINELRRMPVLLSMRLGESLDRQRLCEDERLLHAAGLPYSLQWRPCDDASGAKALANLDRWIMSHVCNSSRAGHGLS